MNYYKRKTYAGKYTRGYRRWKLLTWRTKVITGCILATWTALMIVQFYNMTIEWSQPIVVSASDIENKGVVTCLASGECELVGLSDARDTRTMREWVLDEVKAAGINPELIDCLIKNESGWDANARYVNWHNKQGVDRGLVMINDYWHPDVTNECAYNYKCATKWMINKIKKDKNVSAWYGVAGCDVSHIFIE